ncbi:MULTISPECIES: surface lipoprotein assembly modifier [unclassified Sulfitobacter]|uniref:surface lipoprotein assembly modifier n=1 Tax=unclassified Sulfitobacter TaxID=196795 RepID=UPI003745E1D0
MMTRLAALGARRLLAGLFLALALVSQVPAQQPDAIARAEAQVNAGDYGTAISALQRMGPQAVRDAELRRLWALSMAHVRQGRPRAALPWLDRLVSLAPDAVTYRLELANTLEAAGQAERARYHYSLARGAALPPSLAEEVTRRIDQIDRDRIWEGNFRFAIVPESNPAKRTAADTIMIGDLPFKLKDGSRAQSARGIELGLGLAALPRLGPDLRLRLGAALDARLYEEVAPDDVQARAELGLLHFGDRNRRLGAGITLRKRWIDGEAYANTRGVYLTWGQSIDARARSRLDLTLIRERTDYEAPGTKPATRSVAAASLSHTATPRLQLSFGLQLELTESELATEAGQAGAVTLGARYAFEGGLLAELTLALGRHEREGPDSLLGIVREDRRQSLSMKLTHRDWAVAGFAPVLELGVERQDSSNDLYSYENHRVLLGITRRF